MTKLRSTFALVDDDLPLLGGGKEEVNGVEPLLLGDGADENVDLDDLPSLGRLDYGTPMEEEDLPSLGDGKEEVNGAEVPILGDDADEDVDLDDLPSLGGVNNACSDCPTHRTKAVK